MSVDLLRGARVSLSKGAPGLSKILVGLGWDANSSDSGTSFDLDASAFLLDQNEKVLDEKNFVFFNNLSSKDGSVIHTGDNLTGNGDGDDETIKVDLTKVSSDVKEIVFVVTIYEAKSRKQNFGMVRNAFIRLVDENSQKEIARYDLEEDFSTETAILFGRLYLKDGGWNFNAVGTGFNDGLAGFCNKYGINI
ncbi:TerD family protein [Campylobacter gastrosuis]|uniref:TerD family protein n=1 Tax=Campylobacter gastrosuis TaxID=2974576 RepID=A0ABT7HRL0_9BACT|nr:TerD family protein [Campylobacter gastrosuis]MDL0089549.1 TerD family protein [Campylobacter gastrosuis]